MVRANEDSAAAAVRFIGGLIEDGAFWYGRDWPPASASKRIPLRIVQYRENALPDDVRRLMDDWKAINDDYAYERLDRASAREFLVLNMSCDVQQAFYEAPQASRRANIVRYAYLLLHGGIYADADECCLVPLREWLPHAAAFAGNRKDFGVLNCNFMAVEADSGIMTLALERAARAILDKGPDPLWLTNGPGRLTKAVARHAADRPNMGKGSILLWIITSNRNSSPKI